MNDPECDSMLGCADHRAETAENDEDWKLECNERVIECEIEFGIEYENENSARFETIGDDMGMEGENESHQAEFAAELGKA